MILRPHSYQALDGSPEYHREMRYSTHPYLLTPCSVDIIEISGHTICSSYNFVSPPPPSSSFVFLICNPFLNFPINCTLYPLSTHSIPLAACFPSCPFQQPGHIRLRQRQYPYRSTACHHHYFPHLFIHHTPLSSDMEVGKSGRLAAK